MLKIFCWLNLKNKRERDPTVENVASSGKATQPAASRLIPQTFHPFPRLPLEIRTTICGECLQAPRHLELRGWNSSLALQANCQDMKQKLNLVTGYTQPGVSPTLLCVNQESRSEALRYYIFIRHGKKHVSQYYAFDSSRDVVSFFFKDGLALKWPISRLHADSERKYRCGIRRLLIDERWVVSSDANQAKLQEIAYRALRREFASLDEVVIYMLPQMMPEDTPTAGIRVLERREEVDFAQCWGYRRLQNGFLLWLEKLVDEYGAGPVVKVVQTGWIYT